jgi:hypothetical protein
MKNIIACLIIFLLPISSQGGEAPDILGIKLGANAQETKAKLANIRPNIHINELRTKAGVLAGWNGVVKDGNQVVELIDVLVEGDVVWYVGRAQAFQKGNRPSSRNVMSALTEKYGPYSKYLGGATKGARIGYDSFLLDDTKFAIEWLFDRDGMLLNPKDVYDDHCSSAKALNRATPGYISNGFSFNVELNYPNSFAISCGNQIRAVLITDPSKENAVELGVSIADIHLAYDAAAARENKIKQKEREENQRVGKPLL